MLPALTLENSSAVILHKETNKQIKKGKNWKIIKKMWSVLGRQKYVHELVYWS